MRMTCRRVAAVAGFVVLLAACGDTGAGDGTAEQRAGGGAAAGQPAPTPAEQSYAPELNVDLEAMEQSSTGLYAQDVVEGTGQEARPGSEATVHYTGWLPDGRQFDSSRGGEPFSFVLGQGMVIPGWDEGVAGMREGGQRRLVIPSELAYGTRGAGGVIPPNATLVFDVELLQVR